MTMLMTALPSVLYSSSGFGYIFCLIDGVRNTFLYAKAQFYDN